MKATLEFSLPDENHEYMLTANAGRMASLLHEFVTWMRERRKYGEEKDISYDALWDKFHELWVDEGVPDEIF